MRNGTRFLCGITMAILLGWWYFASSGEDAASPSPDPALRTQCQLNLKQLGLVLKMYSVESEGRFAPPLSPKRGHLFFEATVYPEYLTDPAVVICPADPTSLALLKEEDPSKWLAVIDDHSYFYLGYAVRNEEELKAFAEAYKVQTAKGGSLEGDLDTPKGKIYRLREDIAKVIEPETANDPAALARLMSKIPYLIERPGHHHAPDGGNVLYTDGHVEYRRYSNSPDDFPTSRSSIKILEELSHLK